jgi:hypothetical protein
MDIKAVAILALVGVFLTVAYLELFPVTLQQQPENNTTTFPGNSSITITDVAFCGTSGDAANYINITMKNTGTKQVTISSVRVNGAVKSFSGVTTLSPSDSGKVLMISNVGWSNGNPYKIELYDSSGSVVGSTQPIAPGA